MYNNTTGNYNSAFGNVSGFNLQFGSYNTFVGDGTDVLSNLETYGYSTAIGYRAIIDASNQIVLGGDNGSGVYPNVKIQGGITGATGSFTYLSASQGITGATGSFENVIVSGNLTASSCSLPSDYRIKENIISLDSTFIVDTLNPVTYFNKKTYKQDMGLIAHELQEVYPFLVNGVKDKEELQSVNYIGLIPLLIKEIKELKQRVKMLEERN